MLYFVQGKNNLTESNIVSGAYHLIAKGMVGEFITFMKDKNVAESSGVVSLAVKSVSGAQIDMITNLKKEWIIVGVTPA